METGPALTWQEAAFGYWVRHKARMSTLPCLPVASLQFLKIFWAVILSAEPFLASSGSGCKSAFPPCIICFSSAQTFQGEQTPCD